MVGVELTVGGWFASNIISNIIAMARSVLESNSALQSKTAEMLTSLENSLPRIQATIEAASKRPITNRGLIRWMENLKKAAYEVKDVLDDIEAKRIRESLKREDKVTKFISSSGKFVKTLIFSDKELKGFISAVENFSKISIGIGDFISILQYDTNTNTEHTNTIRRETSSDLDPNSMIFGRDIEIWFILDIILNQITSFPQGNSVEREVKGNTSVPQSEVDGQEMGSKKSVVNEQSFGITTYEKVNTSEVERKGKGKEISSTESSVGEVERKGKGKEISSTESSVGEVERKGKGKEISCTESSVGEVERKGKGKEISSTESTVGEVERKGEGEEISSRIRSRGVFMGIRNFWKLPFGISSYFKGNTWEEKREGKGKGNSEETEVKGNTSESESQVDGQEMGSKKSVVNEQSFGITTYEKVNTSEVERKGKGKEISSIVRPRRVSVQIRNWKLPVLPIYGLGGVGKTTIAQMVYNNDVVTEIFDLRAWVYVPENFDRKKIMSEMVRNLSNDANDKKLDRMNIGEIVKKLRNSIENMRFFLVLDDVHDGIESIWSELFSLLSNGAPGSFVLVTTQSERVARIIGNMSSIITLGVLEPGWFDLLFKYYAFQVFFYFDPKRGKSRISCTNNIARAQLLNLDEEKLSDLKSIATEIAKKLHGLPLAGRVIGKMLYANLEKEHWEMILKSDWWDDENTSKEILASLSIGYKNLDPELQQCFKFCSIFPKHYAFDRNTLVQMWMAHDDDFVRPNEGESFKLHTKEIRLEDVGGERFDKLVERSFFEATVSDGKYVMHGLIRELAIAVSPKHEFYHVKSLDNKIPSVTHHIGINGDGSSGAEISPIYTKPRTVILFGDWKNCTDESISNIFAKSKSLRLLDIAYIGMRKTILDVICELSHLRFVDLSFSGIRFLSDKFCELYHLQVLDVRDCRFRKLPKGMNKLINLRHLYASADTVNLISGIGKLTNLQELEEFCVRSGKGHKISELRDMNEIRGQLLLTNLENVKSKEEAATSQLAKKKYLKSLRLEFEEVVEQEVLDALKPSPSVEMLTIESYTGEYLPGWIIPSQNEVSNLKCVEVSNFRLTALPAFGELPSLEVLSLDEIENLETVGDEFYGCKDVVFSSLKELTFSNMSCWRAWFDPPVGRKSFPHLKKIHIANCFHLKEMPTNCFTSSMAELKLFRCPRIRNIATVLQSLPSLTHLSIDIHCNDLSLYCTGLRFLEVLCVEGVEDLCLVGGLKSLVNLRKLEIKQFDEILESFEGEQEHDESSQENQFLTSLHLSRSSSTQSLPIVLRFGHLRSLLISNSPVTEYTEEEESWFNQLTSLETLEFSFCKNLTRLPSTLLLLTKLKKLVIESCPSISSLPEAGLPRNLTELYITRCSDELVHRCQSDQGDDWWKISHIPHVEIKDY